MFGFIRPVKAELRVKEADRFQQVYCGLCHAIRAEYGRFYTLFLSYDMTFLHLLQEVRRRRLLRRAENDATLLRFGGKAAPRQTMHFVWRRTRASC